MQFNYRKNVKSDIVVVTFTNFNISRVAAKEKLFFNLKLLGGNNPQFELEWIFPSFVSSVVIAQVINNTCFVCGGLMQDAIALQNTLVSSNDFGNDSNSRGTTQSRTGNTKLIQVRKCSQCGHSHT
jgi:hypothetical protein